MPEKKERLDQALVRRGMFDSREKARRAVMAGLVQVDGQKADKPGTPTPSDASITVTAKDRYVGRGGLKLEAALKAFAVDPTGRDCLDIGASTGGFTDCMLQHGATKVFAIDVGHGQIDWHLRSDPRVVVMEGLNARHLTREHLGQQVGLAVADVSFISLTLILPRAFDLLEENAEMIVLIKPQFELSAAEVGKGGVVREEASRQKAAEKIRDFVLGSGHRWLGLMDSPIAGREGNIEFLAHLAK